eukprot:CAMPEP_0194266858 /NCGR_PEP_ID=MMETSP0169-20130528/1617_1 /TAXON_ID=218684 /ORGANISM="Corethron pennatum, Strain L29A3" /LENGTH=438 /DNA_ID=CAMNT_0039007633 /DNA_START=284 /DNA_END=1600 /DNA_ORIENTATION=-
MSFGAPFDETIPTANRSKIGNEFESKNQNNDFYHSLPKSTKHNRDSIFALPKGDIEGDNDEKPFDEVIDEQSKNILRPIKAPVFGSRFSIESRQGDGQFHSNPVLSTISKRRANVKKYASLVLSNTETSVVKSQGQKYHSKQSTPASPINENSVVTSFIRIGVEKFNDEKFDESLACFLKALKTHKDAYPPSFHYDFYTACILNNIGAIYLKKGQLKESLAALNESLILKMKNKSGKKSINCAETLNNIGNIYSMMGKNNEALNIFNEVMEIQHVNLRSNPAIADTHHNIGVVHYLNGEMEASLPHLQKALELKRSEYGDNHIQVADTLEKIGAVYSNRKMFDEALEAFQEEAAIMSSILGPNHPDAAASYHNVGEVHRRSGNFPLALATYLQAYKIYRGAGFRDEHPSVLTVCRNIKCIRSAMMSSNKVRNEIQHAG